MNALRHPAVVLLAAMLALTGCEDSEVDAGSITSERRDLSDFDSIEIEGAARLEVIVGEPQSVVVEARREVINRVKTDVHGDTLHIRSKPKDWFIVNGRPRVTVKVTVPALESLRLEGGNDVRLSGFDGGATRIRAEGASHIRARGRVEQLTVHMAGAGHANLTDLEADDVKVTVDGVGSVYVHPRESLDASMNGLGAILYAGAPNEVSTRMNGLGTIGRRDIEELRRGDRSGERVEHPDDRNALDPEHKDDRNAPATNGVEII